MKPDDHRDEQGERNWERETDAEAPAPEVLPFTIRHLSSSGTALEAPYYPSPSLPTRLFQAPLALLWCRTATTIAFSSSGKMK